VLFRALPPGLKRASFDQENLLEYRISPQAQRGFKSLCCFGSSFLYCSISTRGATMNILKALPLLAALVLPQPALAHDYSAGDLRIGHPYARSTPPGARVGGAYLSVDNKGKTADRLLRASTSRAGTTELHSMSMDGNIMRMRQVPAIEVAAGASVKLAPGGLHIMLMDLKQPLKTGDKFPMTLVFERAGEVKVDIVVEDAQAQGSGVAHQH
jgi:copper(I)-binding protein